MTSVYDYDINNDADDGAHNDTGDNNCQHASAACDESVVSCDGADDDDDSGGDDDDTDGGDDGNADSDDDHNSKGDDDPCEVG